MQGASTLPINTTRIVSISRYARAEPTSPIQMFFMCALSTRQGVCVVWVKVYGQP